MVFIEPSLSQQLGPGLDQLIAGINHAINPDYGFQEKMKIELANNPKLAQNLADLEATAPGTLKGLGFGPLTKLVSSIPESAAGQVARESKGNIVQVEKGKIALEGQQTQFESNKFADALQNLEDPVLRHEFINRFLTGSISPETDIALKEAQTKEQTSRANIIQAQEPGEIAEAKAKKELQDAIDAHPELKSYDPVRIVRALSNGQSVPNLDLYLARPGAKEALTAARIIFEAQANRDQREFLRMQFNHTISQEEKQNIQRAGQFLFATKAGTLQAWRTVLENPGAVEAIQKKSPEQLDQSEKDVLHAFEAQQQQQDLVDERANQIENLNLRQAHNAAASAVKSAESKAGLELALTPLNNILATRAKHGGELYQARYGKVPEVGQPEGTTNRGIFHPFGGNEELFYVDKAGRRVEDTAPFVTKAVISPEGFRTLGVIQGKKGADKDATVAWLKANKPEIYNQIKDQIKP